MNFTDMRLESRINKVINSPHLERALNRRGLEVMDLQAEAPSHFFFESLPHPYRASIIEAEFWIENEQVRRKFPL